MNRRSFLLVAAAALSACATGANAEDDYGHFTGKFVAEFDNTDGRKVTLQEPYGFIDPQGMQWDVPTGYQTDGASVPAALWALYPPFTGNYRQAAVIHDFYCDSKKRSWQDTHKVFYYAMRAANVDEKTAKIMYGAVYLFGPRWGPGTQPGQHAAPIQASTERQQEVVKQIQAMVAKDNPDLDDLLAKAKTIAIAPAGGAPQGAGQ
jgi:hypothetical protein